MSKNIHRETRPSWRLMAKFGCMTTVLATCALDNTALAAPPPISITASDSSQATSEGPFGFLSGINRSSALLGDMWGLRTAMSQYGLSLSIQETSEDLGNTSGGVRKGFEYDGLTQAVLQMNTQRAFGLYGGLFNISGLQIHGNNLSANNLQSLQTASGIESDRATRLWELWYDQKFLEDDRMNVKIGQQSLDQEFMVSSNALYFVNTMFGWPMLPSANMPGGGPAYPLSALGVRVSFKPTPATTILAGVFNGSPVKHDNGTDPQLQNNHGTSFPLGEGTLSIVELQLSYPALGGMVAAGESPPLGWTYRLGAWYDTQGFADQRYDQDGLSLANPNSSGIPQTHHGNYAIYAVADRLIWRAAQDPNRTIGVFARIMGTPLSDRNLISSSANVGLVFHSPFTYRTDDTFGLGAGYTRVTSQAAGLDTDTANYANTPAFARGSESFAEMTYQYQVKPWLQLQPDVQYVFRPGAGLANPDDPTQRIKNEFVLGVRTNISF